MLKRQTKRNYIKKMKVKAVKNFNQLVTYYLELQNCGRTNGVINKKVEALFWRSNKVNLHP